MSRKPQPTPPPAQPGPSPSPRRRWIITLMTTFLLVAALTWYLHSAAPPSTATTPPAPAAQPTAPSPGQPERLKVKVLATRHHDPAAFTQGLLLHGGSLFESTGLYGSSSLREVDPATGAVKRKVDVPAQYFAE